MNPPLFDAHLHVIDPRFPLVPNQGWLPEPFTVEDYLARVAGLGLVGGAVVSGSFQGFDQSYLREALRRLGPGFACLIRSLPPILGKDRQLRQAVESLSHPLPPSGERFGFGSSAGLLRTHRTQSAQRRTQFGRELPRGQATASTSRTALSLDLRQDGTTRRIPSSCGRTSP